MKRKIKYPILILGIIVSITTVVLAKPANIIIVRHADRVLPNGVCLSLLGLQRAASLSYYFTESPLFRAMPITHVFAAFSKEPDPYVRCKQTCLPTATKLAVPLNTEYNQYQVREVTQEILNNPKYDGANILMCWEHKNINPLVIALGGEDPGLWPTEIFDQVYTLSFDAKGKPKLQKSLQQLMFGDRATFKDQPHNLPQVPVPCPSLIN